MDDSIEFVPYKELKERLLELREGVYEVPKYYDEDYDYYNGVLNGIDNCIKILDEIDILEIEGD